MAGALVINPLSTPVDVNDWQNLLSINEKADKGREGVSLTEWESDNTTKPEIAEGSVIEIDGAIAYYDADTSLTDESGLADGWCYIKHVVSGTEGSEIVTPTLTNTWGTWDTAKQGYYDGADNRYSLFAMYRSGAITKIFTNKSMINIHNFRHIPIDSDSEYGVYVDKDSPVKAREKIKYQIIEAIGDGTATISFPHSISNAGTNKRVLFVKTAHWNTTGSIVQVSDGFEEMRVEDAQVLMTYDYTTNALSTYRIIIAYI